MMQYEYFILKKIIVMLPTRLSCWKHCNHIGQKINVGQKILILMGFMHFILKKDVYFIYV